MPAPCVRTHRCRWHGRHGSTGRPNNGNAGPCWRIRCAPGNAVVPALHGTGSFDYFAEHPEHAELFNQTMTSISQLTVAAVVAGYDFGRYPTIVDVGGGHGPLLAAILQAAPASRGVLYDLPGVVDAAPDLLCGPDIEDRVRIVTGSFFDGVPGGGDAYVLKNIVHDWSDEQAVQILRNVRAAAGPRATLLLIELVIPDHDRDFPGKWADLEMLLNLAGRERTAEQYRDLLSQAGFHMTRVVRTASPLSVVEANAAAAGSPEARRHTGRHPLRVARSGIARR
ncbi:methyltransferase [Mycobacterium kyorinense]|uniref:methyltransferase n=1 Tax=Mycobacterium kyorinense TaxID=487514 RepID=UPI000704D861